MMRACEYNPFHAGLARSLVDVERTSNIALNLLLDIGIGRSPSEMDDPFYAIHCAAERVAIRDVADCYFLTWSKIVDGLSHEQALAREAGR